MTTPHHPGHGPAAALVLLAAALAPSAARAETYHTCTGFIDSLPAVISTQGTWCLRKDLSTSAATGEAIILDANNITIDCNGYKLGGLGAGDGTGTIGIFSVNRLNHTVRHCNIRGFFMGVYLAAGGGHLVEDNRFDNNTSMGIAVQGDGHTVRRNHVFDTGGTTYSSYPGLAFGIYAHGPSDILENTVENVVPSPDPGTGDGSGYGIYSVSAPASTIVGNRVRGVGAVGAGHIGGISSNGSLRAIVRGNHAIDMTDGTGYGIQCTSSTDRAADNIVIGFGSGGIEGCTDAGGNSF